MIAEDVLERGLAAAADEYDVPEGGLDRVRGLLAPSVAEEDADGPRRFGLHRPGRRGWIALAAAAVVLLIVLPLSLGGGPDLTSKLQTENADGSGAPAAAFHQENPNNAPQPAGAGAARTSPQLSAIAPTDSLDYGAATPTAPGASVDPVTSAPERVVKTGVLDLQVPKGQVSATLNEVTKIATIEGGYIQSSRTSEGGYAPSGQVTVRVPVKAFEDAVSRARRLGQAPGAKVLGLETSGEDVTGKYVDLRARIHVLQRTRDTFLTLLNKATTIGETLSVQQRVSDVQTDIERLQGQLKVLGNRSALSTLTVTIDQKVVATTTKHHQKSGIHKAFDRSVDRFVNGVEAIVAGTGPVLLAIIVIAALWFGGRFGYRVLRRNMV